MTTPQKEGGKNKNFYIRVTKKKKRGGGEEEEKENSSNHIK